MFNRLFKKNEVLGLTSRCFSCSKDSARAIPSEDHPIHIFIKRRLLLKSKFNAFTMTEVVIATVIFTLAMAGVFASISNLRQPAVESTQEVTAAFIGKQILDDLRNEVNAQSWDTDGNLTIGSHVHTPISVGGRSYNAEYTVIADPNGTNARQVTLNISW